MPPFTTDFLELAKALKKGNGLPVYVITGEEPFLRERALRLILESLTPKGEEHAVVRYDGDEKANLAAAIQDIQTPSLFGSTKIALFRGAQAVLETEGETLAQALKEGFDDAHLVLETERVDMRKKAMRAVKKHGGIVTCKRLYDNPPPWSDGPRWETPLARWVSGEAKTQGLKCPLPEAQHLIDRVGSSLGNLCEELEKISLFCRATPRKPVTVTADRIDEVVGEYNEHGLFKLTDAVGSRRGVTALRIAEALFTQGLHWSGRSGAVHDEQTIATIVTDRIYAKIREIYQAKRILHEGGGVDGLVTRLKKHKAFAPKLAKEADKYSFAEQRRLWGLLADADERLKTGRGQPRILLETLILGLTGSS